MRGILLSLAALLVAAGALANDSDRSELLDGVKLIASPGIPGAVATYGKDAFVVVAGRSGGAMAPVVAATTVGKGRVVALGHDGYFGSDALATADTGRLMLNAVKWLAHGKTNPKVGVLACPELLNYLGKQGIDARALDTEMSVKGLDVVCMIHTDLPTKSEAQLKAFLRTGGGLLGASTGWGWHEMTGLPFSKHPLNKLTSSGGLIWTDGMVDATANGGFNVNVPFPATTHAGIALEALSKVAEGNGSLSKSELGQCVATALNVGLALNADDKLFMPKLRQMRAKAGAVEPPSHAKPVTLSEPMRRVAVALECVDAQAASPKTVKPAASAAVFPGAVPADAKPVIKTLDIDPKVVGWHSLGLYAAPGALITVTVPEDLAKKGLYVRIGCHTDENWGLEKWSRSPAISRRFALEAPKTEAANAYGGLIYIGTPDRADLSTFQVTISGGVPAPLFVLGKTSVDEWKSSIRSLPGPWAEIANDRVTITVPSTVVRNLDNPDEVAKFWHRVLDADADLAQIPHERRMPERIVADEQISAGYMHSGYPIMTWLDVISLVVDTRKLTTQGSWGHFHELGHNHQQEDWTWDGEGEVTENLFSLYVFNKVLDKPFPSGHPEVNDRAKIAERVRKHIAEGAPYEKWVNDPFLALFMYIEVIEAFGWEPLQKVFAEYRTLGPNEHPRTDIEKRSQFMVRMSKAVAKNLGPFFVKWGVPTTDESRASVANLPTWMPDDLKAN